MASLRIRQEGAEESMVREVYDRLLMVLSPEEGLEEVAEGVAGCPEAKADQLLLDRPVCTLKAHPRSGVV
jgi:hypothetical protein